MKEDIRNNRQRLLGQCEEKSPLIAEVVREVGWRNPVGCLSQFWWETHNWASEAVLNHEPP